MIWGQPTSQVDERDTMFARAARRPGTPAYDDYYGCRPELKATDDRLRAMPSLLEPGGSRFDKAVCTEAARWFDRIESIVPDQAVVARASARIAAATAPAAPSAPDIDPLLRSLAAELGAVASGCCALDPAFLYSHKGRFDADYGAPVRLDHGSVFVFLVEMDFDQLQCAPAAEALRESARQYYRAALVAHTVAASLVAAGYEAKAHYDAHYDVILPPLAVAAGLGELGRHNLLVADRFGTRVRIGAVTTTAPLRHDAPVSLGVERFCRACRKCADNCPSRALSTGVPELVRGVGKWPTHVERCYGYWRAVGSDCGICMAVCPFSHRNTWPHALVRLAVRWAPCFARAFVWADDLVYGRRFVSRSANSPTGR